MNGPENVVHASVNHMNNEEVEYGLRFIVHLPKCGQFHYLIVGRPTLRQ